MTVVRGIQYLTSNNTLLPLVRQHDLVNAFGVADEAAAVGRLRGMIDLTEPSGPNGGLEVGVISGDSALAGVLTNALAEAGARMPSPAAGPADRQAGDGATTRAELEAQQDLVVERRNEVMRLMQEHGIKEDRPLAYEDGTGEVEETFADPEITAQWKESRERTRLFNQEMAKVVKQGEEERVRKAAEDGRPLPEKSIAGADPAQFPDYLRARRAWEQQLAVLNHLSARQFEEEILKKRQTASAVSTDHDAFHSQAGTGLGPRRLAADQTAAGEAAGGTDQDGVKPGSPGSAGFLRVATAVGLFLLALFLAAGFVLARRRKRMAMAQRDSQEI